MKKFLVYFTLSFLPILGFAQNLVDGCLDAAFGQYPSATYTPNCMGMPELIAGAFTGEFAKVDVSDGTEYIFSSSTTTDFITISNEEGTEVYASGTTPLTWTATTDEVVRYYLHLDDDCNFNTASVRNRMIQCGGIIVIEEPDFDCFQGDGITLTIDDAYNIDITTDFRTADDFIVEAGTQFTMKQITIDVSQQGVPDTVIINIRQDNAGTPGEIIETINMEPTSYIAYEELFGDPVYHLTFDLTTPIEFSAGTYWLQPIMSSPIDDYVWWLTTSTGSQGAVAQRSNDDGASWYADPDGYQMVFFVAGDCDALGVSDFGTVDFDFYPNPVRDVLNIQSQMALKSVEVFNIIGQKVIRSENVNHAQIDVSKLNSGTYVVRATFEDGQVENIKFVKK